MDENSWAERENRRYKSALERRRRTDEARQQWLHDHRDRPVPGTHAVVRIRPRHRTYKSAEPQALRLVAHGIRQLWGDAIRIVAGDQGKWTVWVIAEDAWSGRVLHFEDCESEGEAVRRADQLAADWPGASKRR